AGVEGWGPEPGGARRTRGGAGPRGPGPAGRGPGARPRPPGTRLRIGITLGLHEPRLRQVASLDEAHARYARTIPTALARITRAVKERDSERARSAMLDHVREWARLNPDVDDLPRA